MSQTPISRRSARWRWIRRFVASSAGNLARARLQKRSSSARISLPPSNRLALWATEYKPEGRYIGYCGVYPHFGSAGPIAGEGTLGFYRARPYWGRGFATEAGEAFIRFGFDELKLSRIVSAVEVGNDASIRVLEKLGMTRFRFEPGDPRSFQHYELRNCAI